MEPLAIRRLIVPAIWASPATGGRLRGVARISVRVTSGLTSSDAWNCRRASSSWIEAAGRIVSTEPVLDQSQDRLEGIRLDHDLEVEFLIRGQEIDEPPQAMRRAGQDQRYGLAVPRSVSSARAAALCSTRPDKASRSRSARRAPAPRPSPDKAPQGRAVRRRAIRADGRKSPP